MAKEVERKYLVIDDSYKKIATNSYEITQGYLCRVPESTVRVRIKGHRAFLTVKGKTSGCVRDEWEYEIPLSDAREMLKLSSGGVLEKTRHIVNHEGKIWEIDEFHGRLAGLTVAEIELESPDEEFAIPPFAGKEVTGDPAYYNSNL